MKERLLYRYEYDEYGRCVKVEQYSDDEDISLTAMYTLLGDDKGITWEIFRRGNMPCGWNMLRWTNCSPGCGPAGRKESRAAPVPGGIRESG